MKDNLLSREVEEDGGVMSSKGYLRPLLLLELI